MSAELQRVDTDSTRNRIGALLSSLKPFGPEYADGEQYLYGRAIIQRMAHSASESDDPSVQLSGEQIGAVLDYLRFTEPRDRATWWDEPKGEPSRHCGLLAVLNTLRSSLDAMTEGNKEQEARLYQARGVIKAVADAIGEDDEAKVHALELAAEAIRKVIGWVECLSDQQPATPRRAR